MLIFDFNILMYNIKKRNISEPIFLLAFLIHILLILFNYQLNFFNQVLSVLISRFLFAIIYLKSHRCDGLIFRFELFESLLEFFLNFEVADPVQHKLHHTRFNRHLFLTHLRYLHERNVLNINCFNNSVKLQKSLYFIFWFLPVYF